MNDPHVEWLNYEFRGRYEPVRIDNPPPLEGEYDALRLHLEADSLTVEMKQHFATVSPRGGRRAILKDWMILFSH